MPGEDGKLTPEEHEHVNLWLTVRCPNRACPMCASKALKTGEWIVRNEIGTEVTNIGERTVIPAVLLYCENCGHMMQFSAGFMGLYTLAKIAKATGGANG